MNFREKIYLKAKSIIEKWNEQDIYAISFFVKPIKGRVVVKATFGACLNGAFALPLFLVE